MNHIEMARDLRHCIEMWLDLRIALRTLLRTPLFTGVALASLALGIGANTAIFSVLDRALLRPLPVCDPGRLFVLHSDGRPYGSATADNHETVFSVPAYRDLRNRTTVLDGLVARAGRRISLAYGQESERGTAEIVSGNYFQVLCVRTVLGRVFTDADDAAPGAHPVAVLSYNAWQRRFGSSRSALNQTIRINGHPFTVIGVLEPGFNGLLNGSIPDVIVPLAMSREATPGWDPFQRHDFYWLNLFARLKPGVTAEQATTAATAALRQIRIEELGIIFQKPPSKRIQDEFVSAKIDLRPAALGINELDREWRTPLLAMMGMVGLVLLIACANVANLLIVRAARRQKEIAIRMSLGASRVRIVRQLFIESALLAVTAGMLALLVAAWLIGGLIRLLPESVVTSGVMDFHIDPRILLFTAAVSIGTALIFGLLPAWQATRQEVAATLKAQASSTTAGTSHARMRKAMVLVQVALATVLIILAGLFVRSSSNLLAVQPGFRTENMLTFGMDPRLNGYDQNRGVNLYSDVLLRLRNTPGVTAVAAANPGPLTSSGRAGNITAEGYQAKEGEYTGAAIRGVTPGYFSALFIPMIAGREFTDKDAKGAPQVAIVNEAFAKKYFGSRNPVGLKMRFGSSNKPPDVEIVGLARDYKHGDLREEIEPAAFMPLAQDSFEAVTFYVRANRDEARMGRAVREAVRSVDPGLSIFDMRPMKLQVEDAAFRERFVAALATSFGVLATLLAAMGVYGVIAYMVARRTNEFGIRVALGADRRQVMLLVMKEVAVIAIAGVGIGLLLTLVAARAVESVLYGIRASDPMIYAAAALLIGAVAIGAAFLPARRAASISPVTALRYE